MATLLAADIGGTKSELAIFEFTAQSYTPMIRKRYVNRDFPDLSHIIASFLNDIDTLPLYGSFGVAGIVSGRKAQLTNLHWRVDCHDLEQLFGFKKVVLVNDLTAVCSSIPLLLSDDLAELQQGEVVGDEVKGVIAPGTGLGQGFMVETGGSLFARGSEGGHVDFGPVNEEQVALLSWMLKKKRPVSYEMLVAGPGIADLYSFCRDYYSIAESSGIREQMSTLKDLIPVIVSGAIDSSPCPLCEKAIDLFLSILGSEAGNLALKLYAKGGIYVGGGIIPRLVGKVSFAGFMESFLNKGQMADVMKSIPVYLILRKDAALLGAAYIGRQIQTGI
ncbi:MAG: glucokinase [Desulfobulbaceae bacterium]|nr:glucokinase [Desulfobulbaceae bacterium]